MKNQQQLFSNSSPLGNVFIVTDDFKPANFYNSPLRQFDTQRARKINPEEEDPEDMTKYDRLPSPKSKVVQEVIKNMSFAERRDLAIRKI